MIRIPSFIKESTAFARKLVLIYWLIASALLGFSVSALRLAAVRQNLINFTESTRSLVTTSLAIPMAVQDRQKLLEGFLGPFAPMKSLGLDVLFVVNRDGRIVYSSRPAWLGLMIYDDLFRGSDFADTSFRRIADCFRSALSDCVELVPQRLPPLGKRLTVYLPVEVQSSGVGLPAQSYFIVAAYNTKIAFSSTSQEILPLILFSVLFAGLLTILLWISLRALLLPRLHQAAQTDGLTRLMNRAAFMECAMEALAEAEVRQAPMVFAILDVDHFKTINDSYGHDCGDVALVSVSEVLAIVMRGDDFVCRFGGEEFALLLFIDEASGRKVLERLRLQIEMNRIAYNGREIPITASIGAVATAECGYNVDYLYTAADRCLYAAKQAGRNRVMWAPSESAGRLQMSSATDQQVPFPSRLAVLSRESD